MHKKPAVSLLLAAAAFAAVRPAPIPILPIALTQPAPQLIAALSAAPAGVSRDVAVTGIPPASYAAMEGGQVAALLSLIAWPGAYESDRLTGPEGTVPPEAWRRMSAEDLKSLLSRWDGVNWSRAHNEAATKRQILKSWKAANAAR